MLFFIGKKHNHIANVLQIDGKTKKLKFKHQIILQAST